jgi:hypothetical protein
MMMNGRQEDPSTARDRKIIRDHSRGERVHVWSQSSHKNSKRGLIVEGINK